MLAKITKTETGHLAEFKRTLRHAPERVWAMLTVNDKLSTWFSELRVEDLREGGTISFDLGDGTFEEMKIIELKPYSVLEYTWGNDRVRFELSPAADGGTMLTLKEFIGEVNAHTPKDLAGWDVCLDVIEALLDERGFGDRKTAWEPKYEAYKRALEA
nr:SRPBCC family protein [Paenibacillus sp.]